MANSEVTKKTYVRPDNTAVLTCVHCGRQKVILAESFKGIAPFLLSDFVRVAIIIAAPATCLWLPGIMT